MVFHTSIFIEKNPIIDEIWIVSNTGLLMSYHSLAGKATYRRDGVSAMFATFVNYADVNFQKRIKMIETADVRYSFYYLRSFKLIVITRSHPRRYIGDVFRVMKQFVRDFMMVFKDDVVLASKYGNVTSLAQSDAIIDLDRTFNWTPVMATV